MCEVAEDMGVSEATAQTYIKRIRRKYVAAGWLGRKSGRGFYAYA